VKLVSWIIMLPVALVVIAFAVSNRDAVTVALWPFPGSVAAPLYAFVLAAVAVGFIGGGAVAWLSGGRARRQTRLNARRAETAEDALSRLRQEQADADQRRRDAAALPIDSNGAHKADADAA
jgi:uncharacterized integral membrane protein